MRRPEAWLAALLAQLVAMPELMTRPTQARHYLLFEAILVGLLFTWSKEEVRHPSRTQIIFIAAGIALSVRVHGAWHLWGLVPLAFFLAGAWRRGLWLAACWGIGTLVGAALTGEPVVFLKQALAVALDIQRERAPQWMLVGELRPGVGEFNTLLLLAAVFLWRRQSAGRQPVSARLPLLAMIALNWILEFKADRFWADWGVPAVLVWLALQFEDAKRALGHRFIETFAAYKPWIAKMRPEDRLVIFSPRQPALPVLQWHCAADDLSPTFATGRGDVPKSLKNCSFVQKVCTKVLF